jgi:hypothetical protein
MGMMSVPPTFWTLPTAFLSGAGAAGGIALINSVANIGGFLGPTTLGRLGLWSMAAAMFAGAALALSVRAGAVAETRDPGGGSRGGITVRPDRTGGRGATHRPGVGRAPAEDQRPRFEADKHAPGHAPALQERTRPGGCPRL